MILRLQGIFVLKIFLEFCVVECCVLYGFGTVKHRPLHIVYRFMAAFATSLQITFFPNKKVGQKRPQAFLTHK